VPRLACVTLRDAPVVVLLPATGANVHEGHLAAATDVLRTSLERTGRYLVAPGRSPAAAGEEATAAQAGEAARTAGAVLAVTLRVSRLGRRRASGSPPIAPMAPPRTSTS
jgi:hypothetical protein